MEEEEAYDRTMVRLRVVGSGVTRYIPRSIAVTNSGDGCDGCLSVVGGRATTD